MSELLIDRRNVMTAGAVLAVGAIALSPVVAGAQASPPTGPGFLPQPLALPFDPKTIPGLSERLLVSHHDNNYVGAVRRLGAISSSFVGLDPAAVPGFTINGLKREELAAWNSMILHELYFAGLGGSGGPSPKLAQTIERDFGSMTRWTTEFAAMGKALGGGSGWVLLTYSGRDRRLTNQWAADHTMTLAGSTPLLALDMYEHAYAIDYGSKAPAYVDAYMKAMSWDHANSVFAKVA
jgi:Fe-Mn family superoxide dismutase